MAQILTPFSNSSHSGKNQLTIRYVSGDLRDKLMHLSPLIASSWNTNGLRPSPNIQWRPSQSKLYSPVHGSPEQVTSKRVHKDQEQQGTLLEHGAPFYLESPFKALNPNPRIDILSGAGAVKKSKDAGSAQMSHRCTEVPSLRGSLSAPSPQHLS